MSMRRLKKMKIWRKTLFFKFFLSVLFVSVISVVILTLLMYYWFQGRTLEDISKINKMELLNTEVVYTKYISTSQNFAMELYQSNIIKSTMLSGDTSWSENYSNAISQVQGIISVNGFINSIYIFNANGIVFNVTKKPEGEEAQKELLNRVKSRNVMEGPFVWDMRTSLGNNIHTLTVFFHESISKSGNFDGAIAVNIDLEELKKSIFSEQGDINQKLLIISSDGKMIMQSGKGQNGYTFDKAYIKRILASEAPDGRFGTKIDKNEISVSFVTSRDKSFIVVSEMEYRQSIKALIKQRNVLFTACTLIILFVIGISAAISYVIYKPLGVVFNNIRSLFSETARDKETSEIQLVSNTLTKMVDTINSLEKENEDNSVVKIITSSEKQGGKLPADLLVKAGAIRAPEIPFNVIVIKIDNFKNLVEKNSAEAISFQINSICMLAAEFFNGKAYCSAYRTADDCVVLIVSEQELCKKLQGINMGILMKDLQEIIRKMLKIDVTIGISLLTDDIQRINEKYKEALLLANYRILYGNNGVFQADNIDKLKNNSISEVNMDDILDAVKKSSFEEFSSSLENFIILCRGLGYEKSIKTFSQLAAAILRLSNEAVNEQNNNYLNIYKKISEIRDLNELKDWFTQLYRDTSEVINDVNRKRTQDVVKDVIGYINEHYWDQQLSINSMAERVSISPWYFSRIFNETTGSSFPEYVNNLRLDKAKEMLIQNMDVDINEISQKTGYSSSTYFTTSFKKKFGMTPSKWRLNSKN